VLCRSLPDRRLGCDPILTISCSDRQPNLVAAAIGGKRHGYAISMLGIGCNAVVE
jgi:hypothetical protein